MAKKLHCNNFSAESEALEEKLRIADVCEALSCDNVKVIAIAEYNVLAAKLTAADVETPDITAVQMVRRLAKYYVEDTSRESIQKLVRLVKLKLLIGEAVQ